MSFRVRMETTRGTVLTGTLLTGTGIETLERFHTWLMTHDGPMYFLVTLIDDTTVVMVNLLHIVTIEQLKESDDAT